MNKSNLSVLLALVGLGLLNSKAGAKNTDNISMDLTIDISRINEFNLHNLKLFLRGSSRMKKHIGGFSFNPAAEDDLELQSEDEYDEINWVLSSFFADDDAFGGYGDVYDYLSYEIDSFQDLYELARRFSWANIENIEETDDLLKYKIVVDVDVIFKIWEIDFKKRAVRKISSNFEEYLRFEIGSVLRYAFDIVAYRSPLLYEIDNINIPSYFNTTTIFGSGTDLRRF